MPALSPRLEAVLAAAGPCEMLADVCCDHAWVALAAVARGQAARALAIELRRAPLAVAARHLALSRLGGRVLLVRGAGLSAIRSAEVIVIAGVGGDLAAQLLAASPGCVGARRVIVQPNRHSREVRAWARVAGFHLVAETAVAEGAQLHLVLALERRAGPDPAYGAFPEEAELLLGPRLLGSASPADRLFLSRELHRLRALAPRKPALAVPLAVLEAIQPPGPAEHLAGKAPGRRRGSRLGLGLCGG